MQSGDYKIVWVYPYYHVFLETHVGVVMEPENTLVALRLVFALRTDCKLKSCYLPHM